MVTLTMGHLLPHEVSPPVTLWRETPKVKFDDEAQAYDTAAPDGILGKPVLVDWDVFEEMILTGKFATKKEAIGWCREVYEMLYDPEDEDTHWTDHSWIKIRAGLFPETIAAFDALPVMAYSSRKRPTPGSRPRRWAPGEKLLKAGKCTNGHKINGMDDLASIGPDDKGNPRLGCLHCRRQRSREQRERNRKNRKKA